MSSTPFLERGLLRRFAVSLALLSLASPVLADAVDLDATPADIEVAASGTITYSQSNQALAKGDLNDDGELDLVIGTAGDYSSGGTGGAYVIFGPLSDTISPYDLASDADVEVISGQVNALLGYAVAVADLNADNDDDLIVSAPLANASGGRTDAGAVYVFFGPLSAGTLQIRFGAADLTIFGADAYDQLGHSLTIGDLTSTSDLDLGIGAPFADGSGNSLSEAGEVVFFNGPLSAGTWDLGSTAADETIWGDVAGRHVFKAAIGELSGDLDKDLVITGYGNVTPAVEGRVAVIFGPFTNGTDIDLYTIDPDWVTRGEHSYGDDLVIFDFDGDSQNDLVTLARTADALADYGAVYGFPGPLAGSVDEEAVNEAELQIVYPDFYLNKGDVTSLAFGDVSNDGVADLLIGVIGGGGPEDDRAYAGQVNVFFGPVTAKTYDMAVESSQIVVYGADSMLLGYDVVAGDINDDSQGDLIMLSTEFISGSAYGKLHILLGETCYSDGFDGVSLDSGWTLAHLGTANQGATSVAGGFLDLTGDGTGIIATSDDAVFLYRDDLSGDFRVEATIVGLPTNAGGTYRRGGLWVRSSASPPFGYTADQAPHVSVTYQPTGGIGGLPQIEFSMRQDWGEGGLSPAPNPSVPIASPVQESSGAFMLPLRVAIERIGSEYCVYYFDNADGHPEWKKPAGGQGGCSKTVLDGGEGHPNINNQPDIGLMVAANHSSTTATYRFDDYAICQP